MPGWPTAFCRILLALALAAPGVAAGRWELRFFHDVLDENFTIRDLAFPSANRGVAVGYLVDQDGDTKPMSVVTNDGGATWSYVPINDEGTSLYFLDDSIGWMVTEGGLWRTLEAGRSWEKVSGKDDMLRVGFVDENRGWAVGVKKSIWESQDGGKNWEPLPEAAEPPTSEEYTNYVWIDIVRPHRVTITGFSERPRRSRLPDWMAPEEASRRREWPTSTIVLQSVDAGESWHSSVTSMFGRLTKMRMRSDGTGLSLVRFQNSFEWPSEVYRVNTGTQETDRTYRHENHLITDIMLTDDGGAWLVGVEQPGSLPSSPVPGRLIALRSKNLTDWEETQVDYRARARSAVLATAGGKSWIATDTGMILELEPDESETQPATGGKR